MKTTNKVISLQLAKQIVKEAKKRKIKLSESEHWWAEHRDFVRQKNGKYKIEYLGMKLGCFPNGHKSFVDTKHIQAFDCAELGEMLPEWDIRRSEIIEPSGKLGVKLNKRISVFSSKLDSMGHDSEWFIDETEAECRGKMLYFLLKNNLL